MFRHALAIAAIVAVAGPALAQSSSSGSSDQSSSSGGSGDMQIEGQSAQSIQPDQAITGSMLEDASIMSIGGDYDQEIWNSGSPFELLIADMEEIGSVEDIVMNTNGQVIGVTTDVGGFLGIGQKSVLISIEDVRLARPQEDEGEVTVITRLDQESLQDLPSFELD